MKNSKNRTVNNLINALLAGSILFGCSCTLCNKKYYVNFIAPQIEAAPAPVQKQDIKSQEILEK